MENEVVMVHVRLAPDGSVTEIGARPAATSAQDWFDRLSAAGSCYQPLCGGRGLFRIPQGRLDALIAATAG